ncbi:MAG: hypothetical protein K8Q89_01730 [Nitrosarchaeum sp.]|nr:hypothetical protein [Nitrosarchaeum sp.]
MNTKVKYMIPAFAAVFALVFALSPYVMADNGAPAMWGNGAKHMGHEGPMGGHVVTVDGFVGKIAIPETVDKNTHDSLKSQVSVTLGQAVSAAEAKGVTNAERASIGVVQNQEGSKYLAWIITSTERDVTTGIITTNIIVVDAGDATHSDSTTKTFDLSTMKDKMQNGTFDHSKWSDKMTGDNAARFEQFKQKFSQPTGDQTVDAARAHFLDLKQKLHDAIQNGDTTTAQDIKKQLNDLRPSLHFGMKSPGD